MTLSTDNVVSLRPMKSRKARPFTMYDGLSSKFQLNLESTNNANNRKMGSKTAYNIYNIHGSTSVDKKFISCNNLSNINNIQQSNSYKNTPTMKRTLSIRRPKSLQRLNDDLRPLLDTASSLSSIGSYNELTEESVIDSSDDSHSIDINNVVLRKGGKLRSLKHRTRSTVLTDRNLGSIPENILAHNLRKRHGIHSQSLNHIACNDITSGLENILTDFGIDEDKNVTNRQSIDRSCSLSLQRPGSRNTNSGHISSNCVSMQNIAIPRRKSKNHEISQAVSTVSISEQSFSKEQKKKLKKKMRDTKKSPENSVFLGLF